MTGKRTKLADKKRTDAQLGLFLSEPDHSSASYLLNESSSTLKSAGEIEENNLAACLRQFFIKKHHATTLHYDFRLGHNGVLVSWAIEIGPSYYPGHKRKATQVDDHRKEYGGFEGVLPEGTYGAGPTILWDSGMWKPLPEYLDVDESLRKGCLKFTLDGKKLKGKWTLIWREGNKKEGPDSKWYLIKEPDSFARSEDAKSILEEEPNSVSTGRSLEDVKREWTEGKKQRKSGATLFQAQE
jgi:bifunctional non-homologous end joining protein LigD